MAGGAELTEIAGLVPDMRAYARAFLPGAAAADELVQAALTQLGQMGETALGAQTAAFTALREVYYDGAMAAMGPADAGGTQTLPQTLPFETAFYGLPPEAREALTLTAGAGLSLAAAARIMGQAPDRVAALTETGHEELARRLGGGESSDNAPTGGAASI